MAATNFPCETSSVVASLGFVAVVASPLASLSYYNVITTATAKLATSQISSSIGGGGGVSSKDASAGGACLWTGWVLRSDADMHECRRVSRPWVPQLGCVMGSPTQERSRKAVYMWRMFMDGAILQHCGRSGLITCFIEPSTRNSLCRVSTTPDECILVQYAFCACRARDDDDYDDDRGEHHHVATQEPKRNYRNSSSEVSSDWTSSTSRAATQAGLVVVVMA